MERPKLTYEEEEQLMWWMCGLLERRPHINKTMQEWDANPEIPREVTCHTLFSEKGYWRLDLNFCQMDMIPEWTPNREIEDIDHNDVLAVLSHVVKLGPPYVGRLRTLVYIDMSEKEYHGNSFENIIGWVCDTDHIVVLEIIRKAITPDSFEIPSLTIQKNDVE